jgi:hypothetical protein
MPPSPTAQRVEEDTRNQPKQLDRQILSRHLRDRPQFETEPTTAGINGIGITARRRHVDTTLKISFEVPSAEIDLFVPTGGGKSVCRHIVERI